MEDHVHEQEEHIETNNDHYFLKTIQSLQDSHPSDNIIILQAFLHLNNSFLNQQEYSNEFIQYQLDLFKQTSSTLPILFDLLKQIVPTSKLVLSFNSIRQSIVESWIQQFRKDTLKFKWGGNGEKISLLTNLLKRSLKLYSSNENQIKDTINIWYSTVLHLFEPLIDELNDYLKIKIDKQQQYISLNHLIKPLGELCEQLNKIDENKDCLIINEYFSHIFLATLQQKLEIIINKKILDHFDSYDKLEEYKCSIRTSLFTIYPDIHKLLTILDDARVSKNAIDLIKKCNEKFSILLAKVSQIYHNYPSLISLEHCICLLSSLSSIEILYHHEQFQYFLYNFSQYLLTYWQINLLHDCDADDWLNTKSYFENTRYSVYIDTLFYHFNRFHTLIKRYCPCLLSILIPYLLIELMKFIYHRYASIKISYERQKQYKFDLLAFLVYLSEFAHYFVGYTSLNDQFFLFKNENIESKFIEHGNEIVSAIVLVTCPCALLNEQLENLVHRSARLPSKINWLNLIRPDWFDINYELRTSVQDYLIIKNIIETRHNRFSNEKLTKLVMENSELYSYRIVLIHFLMQDEQWKLIYLFVKHEHDWLFLTTHSVKFPEWISTMMKYWKEFFAKCCSTCANEKEVEWRNQIQQILQQEFFDEKLMFLKTLQQCLANLPLSLYHLLCAIHQYQSQYSKRMIFACLLYKYLLELKFDRASIYYSYLIGHDNDNYHAIEKLLERRSPLFRFPYDELNDEQIKEKNPNAIVEILTENFEKIYQRLDVKTLDEYYITSHTYSQMYSQQRQFGLSTENLNASSTKEEMGFTDLNLRISKRSFHHTVPTAFKIDYMLVSRIELDWPMLFTHLIVRLKSSIIYHFITLRFEFQASASSSLTDEERLSVGKLIELLPPFLNEKK